MYAMQYPINLPADYDMQVIRDRVARNGAALDGFPGLRFKAYLIRERAQGAPTNEYAPFYVWDDVDGMRRFLWGGAGFAGIVGSFGRPAVQDWTVADVIDGPAHEQRPTWATKQTTRMLEGAVPDDAVPAALTELRAGVTDTTHTAVLAVDVTAWTLTTFALHVRRPEPGPETAAYEVLYLAR